MNTIQMLLNNGELDGVRLLSRKTIELMTTNHLAKDLLPFRIGTPNYGLGFGLGFAVVMDIGQASSNDLFASGSVGTYGWAGSYNTYFWVDPKEGMIGLIMIQYTPSLDLQPILQEFQTLVYQAVID